MAEIETIKQTEIDKARKRAKATGKIQLLTDKGLRGFYVRVRPPSARSSDGVVSFAVQKWIGGRYVPGDKGGKSRFKVIGQHGQPVSAKDARIMTVDYARKLAMKEIAASNDYASDNTRTVANPFDSKRRARERLTAATLGDALKQYLELCKTTAPGWAQTERLLKFDLENHWLAKQPMNAVDHEAIGELLDDIKRRSPSVARAVYAALGPFMKWCVSKKLIRENPMPDVIAPALCEARDRWLDDAEVRAFWRSCDKLLLADGTPSPFQDAFKLLLLTAQRLREVCGMRWREINLDAGEWIIPKERAKNGVEHAVDLGIDTRLMLLAIQERQRAAKLKTEFVFTTTSRTPISGYSKVKARLNKHIQGELGTALRPWRLHDLRRTAATNMAGAGVLPQVIERIINHISGTTGNLVGVYQHHQYRAERRAASDVWESRVFEIVLRSV